MTAIVIIHGIELEIEFDVTKYYPATYETPEEGGEIDIYSVKVRGIDIIELLSEEAIRLIECTYLTKK